MIDHNALSAGPGPLVLLLFALAFDAYIGDPPLLYRLVPHPVALMGRLIASFERRLNRRERSERNRRFRGFLVAILLVGFAALVGWTISRLAGAVAFGWLVELVLVMTLLAQRSLYLHVVAVARRLEEDGLAGGCEAVAHIVGRNPANLDEFGVARAAIESCAENLSDGVIAPVLWYLALGLPGLFAYKMLNTADSMIGHLSPRYKAFGATTARLDALANYIPARLTALLIVLAAVAAQGANPWAALKTAAADAAKHRSTNAGWPEAAMAGALGLALAGPRRYGERLVKDAWMGEGRARATARDIHRALYVAALACAINFALIALGAALI
jgi:adenosylcobinamide-phosphate synthase